MYHQYKSFPLCILYMFQNNYYKNDRINLKSTLSHLTYHFHLEN